MGVGSAPSWIFIPYTDKVERGLFGLMV